MKSVLTWMLGVVVGISWTLAITGDESSFPIVMLSSITSLMLFIWWIIDNWDRIK